MYLVSLYFDSETNNRIRSYIEKVSMATGNKYMIDGKVPPHITIAAFDNIPEEKAIELLDDKLKYIRRDKVLWASIGVFKSNVIYITPILSEYLHNISVEINYSIECEENISISKFYRPFNWLPHTTIGKKLVGDEIIRAFYALQNCFTMFSGDAIRIGLSITNPHREIYSWNLD